MELYEFNILHSDAQVTLISNEGTYLMSRNEGEFTINLYSLFNFYVEAWYFPNSENIEKLRTFRSLTPLEPYLNQIEIK